MHGLLVEHEPLMTDVARAAQRLEAITNRVGKVADLAAMPPYLRHQRIMRSSRRRVLAEHGPHAAVSASVRAGSTSDAG